MDYGRQAAQFSQAQLKNPARKKFRLPSGPAVFSGRHMNLFLDALLYFATFSAMAVLFMSATVATVWAALSFLRAMFGFPRALRELRTRRHDRQADLNRLKRAGV
jgi:Flp pilus assembly protein TadB